MPLLLIRLPIPTGGAWRGVCSPPLLRESATFEATGLGVFVLEALVDGAVLLVAVDLNAVGPKDPVLMTEDERVGRYMMWD